MTEPTHVFPLRQPHALDDPLTDLLRAGARQLLAQAIEIEAEAYLASMRE
jgi:putative transposase